MEQLKRCFNLTLIVCFSLLCPLTFAATINVPADQPTIQSGIDAAQNSDTVLVDDGVYKGEGNVNLDFKGKEITLKSRNGAEDTIIDCEEKQYTRGFWFLRGETDTSVLDGFTIKNGNNEYGGGILFYYASPTVKNCVIENNTAIKNGGLTAAGAGFYIFNADPIIDNCTIARNFGTGIFVRGIWSRHGIILKETGAQPIIKNCTISDNTGTGILCMEDVDPMISNCTVSKNGHRGIVYNFFARANNPIINCRIEENEGGGLKCSETSLMIIEDSIIKQNTAENGGGISCSPTSTILVTNCLIVQNTATRDGGGIGVISTRGSATFTNCTISQNAASRRGGGISAQIETGNLTLSNSIVWDNTSDGTHAEVFAGGIVIKIKSCDIKGGLDGIGREPNKYFVYEDNIDEDPLFVDPDSGDFSLKPNSPAAAMGINGQEVQLAPYAKSQHTKRLVKWVDLKRKPRITSIY